MLAEGDDDASLKRWIVKRLEDMYGAARSRPLRRPSNDVVRPP